MAEPTEPASADPDGRKDGLAERFEQTLENTARPPGDKPVRTSDGLPVSGNAREARSIDAAAGDDAASAPAPTNIPWPRLARADDLPARSRLDDDQGAARLSSPWWIWIGAQVCGFGLLLGGYFLGQAWSPATRPASPRPDRSQRHEAGQTSRVGGERALEAANRGLKAERSRDFPAARAIYDEMVNRQTPVAGAEYRLALLSLHEGDYARTEAHLYRSVQAGDDVADCCLLRASLAGMKSNYGEAAGQLAAAVRAQPFNARFCFCWGEALRRAGRLPDAVERLTEALDRPDNATARELYLFKLRLATAESGGGQAFDAEVAAHVEQPSPGGDWLLLSAAREIGRGNFAAAAERLEQAKAALPSEVFGVYVQDYLFQAQASRPELSGVLNVPPPATGAPADAPIQDPAVWTAAEADPAVWPPFSKAP